MSQPVFDTWSRRGDALAATMQEMMQAMQQNQPAVERQPTLVSLLACLRAFGQSQLKYFIDGFRIKNGKDTPIIHLEPSTTYPPEYAMRVTLDQMAYDLDVIQRAYTQRLPGLATDEMRRTLAKADILAYQAVAPAIEQGLIDNTTVVTYFQKSVNVRILPYAPVAFIGLPMTALTVRRDLLAIPHEVGHYIYRNGKAMSGQFQGSRFAAALNYELQKLPKWCQAWTEEIFADVYGAVIGGPVMALGFEELVTDDRIEDFTKDDGEHPIAALRPDIYYEVFAQQKKHKVEAALLEKRWNGRFEQRGAPKAFTPASKDEWWEVELPEAKETIKQAITTMLKGDLGQLETDPAQWSGTLARGANPEDLYAHFDQIVDEQLPDTTADKVPDVELTFDDDGNPCCIHLRAYVQSRSTEAVSRP
ncbi:MAG: hypothetical protein KDE19_07920, partial [Caldilineaceae bacterium]|nr:hypothetical protein [Caldilineaceae bacterium]